MSAPKMSGISELENQSAQPSIDYLEHQSALYRQYDSERESFMQALLQNLREKHSKLIDLGNDLENERESRKHWQAKARASEHEAVQLKGQTESSPFVVAILDGDGALFRDSLVTATGESGGADAAHELMQAINNFVAEKTEITNRCAVVVKIFANLEGLYKAYQYHGILQRPEQLMQFYRGFTSSQHQFDFIDVGSGKERADTKLRENFNFYLGHAQCKHIFLGGICHDTGYRNIIAPYGRDPQITSRVTLLQTYASCHPEYKTTGFDITRFEDIFRDVQLQESNKKIKMPTSMPPGFATSPEQAQAYMANSAGAGASAATYVKAATPPASVTAPTPPPPSRTPLSNATNSSSSATRAPTQVDAERGRRLFTNRNAQRLDPPIRPPPTSQAKYNVDDRKADGPLCNKFHISGYCPHGEYCNYQHGNRLIGAELSVLVAQARTTPCPKYGRCRDFACCLGHVCQGDPCKFPDTCKFRPDAHRKQMSMVAELRHFENGEIQACNLTCD